MHEEEDRLKYLMKASPPSWLQHEEFSVANIMPRRLRNEDDTAVLIIRTFEELTSLAD